MKPQRSEIAFGILATLMGLVVRLAPALGANFPLNDGGLFYAMIGALRANGYALPAFVNYNGIQIPFAYPPLGLYLTTLFADLTRLDLLNVMRWLPPLVSVLSIPAFYWLVRKFSSQTTAAFGTLIFALTPRAFTWLMMGGGVTRAFGFVFEILTLGCAARLFTAPTRRLVFWTSACAALTVLTHPEASVHTALAAVLMYLFFDRSRAGLFRGLAVAALTLLLTSPWWGLTLTRHGIAPFLAASAAVRADGVAWFARPFLLLQFDVLDEPFLKIISVLGLVGIFLHTHKRDVFLPTWLALAFLFEPRGALQTMSIPISLLAASTLTDLILPRLSASRGDTLEELLKSRNARAFFGVLFILLMTGAYFTANKIAHEISLTRADLKAFEWVQANISEGSAFAIVTGERPLLDAVSEWFPALTGRISAATVFGYEWIASPPFASRVDAYKSLQACMYKDSSCLETWTRESGASFDYVLIRNYRSGQFRLTPLQVHLDQSADFTLVYQKEDVTIYHIVR